MEHDLSTAAGTLGVNRAWNGYLDRILAQCPGLPRTVAQSLSVAIGDAVVLAGLLDGADKPVQILDVGSAMGTSTFLFASHPLVRRVVSITTNSSVSEKISQTEDEGLELSQVANVRTQDLVRRIVAEFPQPAAKLEYFDGVLFESGDHGAAHEAAVARFDPVTIGTGEGALVAFLDGQRTSRGIFANLDFLLEARPDALVLLNNCRGRWGPFVQGGVACLLETYPERYAFQLLADLAPGLGGSNLGVVYVTDSRQGVPELVSHLVGSLGMQLDPLTLLERQQTQLEFTQEMTIRATEAEAEGRWLKSQLEAVRRTTSWRVTAPIRAASRLLKGRR